MFSSLKNKIKEETGSEIPSIPVRHPSITSAKYSRNRESMSSQHSIEDATLLEQKDAEINSLKSQLTDYQNKLEELSKKNEKLNEEKCSLEKANSLLEESLKVAQVQKEMLCEEQDKIQNLQSQEIAKLKSLLLFREQEAVDRLTQQKTNQTQIENLKAELSRIKNIEPMFEDMKDELENLRHSSEFEKNSLVSQLAAKEEEIRHYKMKLDIVAESRAAVSEDSENEKINLLLQERKLLEQRLEEAHLHLFDIKRNWSFQNLTLETQLSRLSRQVAEETTEKRKILEERDELNEKLKKLQMDILLQRDEITQRDNKIKLLSEEVEDLNTTLSDFREENNETVAFLKNKVNEQNTELDHLKDQLLESDDVVSESTEAEIEIAKLKILCQNLEKENQELEKELEKERDEKLELQLRNAEISQGQENLRRELRDEQDDSNELNEKIKNLENELNKRLININELNDKIAEQTEVDENNKELLAQIDRLNNEVADKNKAIKILNQRLFDMKKTLHEEIKNSNSGSIGSIDQHGPAILTPTNYNDNNNPNNTFSNHPSFRKIQSSSNISGPIVIDEVNFRYLKHVILKFLTSREYEAKHLIKAVSTLLYLTKDEEKLLTDTLNWKMSWFGSKPDFYLSSK